MPKQYRILTLDGGGIRGLMTAIWLKKLEDKLGSPLHRYFDLVAGTSTGALLACGISKGLPLEKAIEFYVDKGNEVFPSASSRLWNRVTRLFSDGTSAPKYDGTGLEKALKDVFKTTVFSSLKIKPTLVTSYDVFGREAIVFKNTKPEHQSLRVWEICKASAAAPSYFPAHMMQVSGVDVPLIDGGVVANNPTACAIAEGARINGARPVTERVPLEDFVVASFGTGEAIRRIQPSEAKEWGALEWAVPIIDVLFDGSGDSVHYIASQLLSEKNYFRFQTRLDEAYDDLDNADRTNLQALMRLANQYIESTEGRDKLESLVERLTNSN